MTWGRRFPTAASASRRRQGAIAKQAGATFERVFERACRRILLVCTRTPDGCRQAGPQLIRVKTYWDWVLTHESRTALIDTKTSDAKSFPHSKIESHQAKEMHRHEQMGALAGYVVHLRPINSVIFVPSSALVVAMAKRGSIGPGDPVAVKLGPVETFDPRLIFADLDEAAEGALAATEAEARFIEQKGNA